MANLWRKDGRKFLSEMPNNKGLDWSERTNIVAKKVFEINPIKVYDFGSGECRLSKMIGDISYIGVDSQNFSIYENTEIILVDLNLNFPKIKVEANTIGLCIGILEYINNKNLFIENLSKNFEIIIFSYNFNKSNNILKYFTNYFSKVEFISDTKDKPPGQAVFLAKK